MSTCRLFTPVNTTATDAFSESEKQAALSIIGQQVRQGVSHNILDDRRAE